MTRFGVTSLLAAIGLLLFSALHDSATEFVRATCMVLAGVLVGAFIAVEARHQHMVSTRRRREHDEHREEDDRYE